jgi:hypothetical protein
MTARSAVIETSGRRLATELVSRLGRLLCCCSSFALCRPSLVGVSALHETCGRCLNLLTLKGGVSVPIICFFMAYLGNSFKMRYFYNNCFFFAF